ncbi:hypothetical protein ACH4S8_37275 [Streptomyces sp. NPDC021080]|uniref:hypothetical protein n=1 Tax=Streptomyces sp. NPDC021080 TaxID=3365110 RepID=UPI00379329DB
MTAATQTHQEPELTSQNWAGHWHGFGPWIGSPAVYHAEGNRRPAHPVPPAPPAGKDDKAGIRLQERYREAAVEFSTGDVPPIVTGHWLVRMGRAAAERTWTDLTDAVEWLKAQYTDNPPFERADGLQAYLSLDDRIAYAYDGLPRGVDTTWCYYTPAKSLLSMSVVCCPNLFLPKVACPLPPRR